MAACRLLRRRNSRLAPAPSRGILLYVTFPAVWTPTETANLCFIIRDGQVLLIRKKRGLGAGKVNAPGGKVEPGETPLEAAIRETIEEVGVRPVGVRETGVLRFSFADGYRLLCHVFVAVDCEGEAHETPEALPFWVSTRGIPYDEMWADDRHWLPLLLANVTFRGHFEFDGDKLLSRSVERVSFARSAP
jgi:8-oxo-dGTP diphosphatase